MRLTVLVTSPRLPAGLLTGQAWRALHEADQIVAETVDAPLVRAVVADGLDVAAISPDATRLLELAEDKHVVWLASDDGDEDLTHALAAAIVQWTERGDKSESAPTVEIVIGSFDPLGARMFDLIEVMDRLRRECPWDKKQTHESLVRYLIEEAYETIDAIESGDRDHLREELGDLLLQVVFHARLAEEDHDAPFNLDDVAGGIVDKLIRRHPHVFGDVDAADADAVERNWAEIKAAEKPGKQAMDDIPRGLPALSLATKVIDRAVERSKALSVPYPDEQAFTADTLGDVLFALVAAAHAAGIDAELALRQRVLSELEGISGDPSAQRAAPADLPDPS